MLSTSELEQVAKNCRNTAITMAEACGSGHLGGSFSIMDVLVALEFRVMKKDDVLIYSKAHCCEALYAVLREKTLLSSDEMDTFGEWGSRLQGHSEHWALEEVDFSGGSLGQGFSFACGVALGKKLKGDSGRVFCIVGDGECQEGQIWEAIMFKQQYGLNNLVVIVDWNGHTGDCKDIRQVMNIDILVGNEDIIQIVSDGHKFKGANSIIDSLTYYDFIVFKTVKGRGVTTWERSCGHLQYGNELEEGIKEWRSNGT